MDLAFIFQQEILVEGVLPDGGHNSATAKLPTIAAFLCIKAITLSERMKKKDAYDICFCIENYPGGYKALADEFRGKLENKLIGEGIAILREKFARLDSIGPVWAAQVAEEATAGTAFDLEMEQRRAYEVVMPSCEKSTGQSECWQGHSTDSESRPHRLPGQSSALEGQQEPPSGQARLRSASDEMPEIARDCPSARPSGMRPARQTQKSRREFWLSSANQPPPRTPLDRIRFPRYGHPEIRPTGRGTSFVRC